MAPETLYKHYLLDVLTRTLFPENGNTQATANLLRVQALSLNKHSPHCIFFRINNQVYIRTDSEQSFLYSNTQYVDVALLNIYKNSSANQGMDVLFSKINGYPLRGTNCCPVTLSKKYQKSIDVLLEWDKFKLKQIYAFTKFVNTLPSINTVIAFIEKYSTYFNAPTSSPMFWTAENTFDNYIENIAAGADFEIIESFEKASPSLIEELNHNKFLKEIGN